MIDEHDILSLNYLKKQAYTGSYQGMRYMLKKKEDKEAGTVQLEAAVWPEPMNLEHTDDHLITRSFFEFSEQGRRDAIAWLQTMYSTEWENRETH